MKKKDFEIVRFFSVFLHLAQFTQLYSLSGYQAYLLEDLLMNHFTLENSQKEGFVTFDQVVGDFCPLRIAK